MLGLQICHFPIYENVIVIRDVSYDICNICNGTFLYNTIVVSTYVIAFKECFRHTQHMLG